MSSIFLEINLPNTSTWFYFSLFLTLALFFQFWRLFTLRNWDLLALFLFTPGFLLIQDSHRWVSVGSAQEDLLNWSFSSSSSRLRFIGYLWLLCASVYWFVRCLVDWTNSRRPLLTPNINSPGLICFAISLLVCLCAVALSRPHDPWEVYTIGNRTVPIPELEESASVVIQGQYPDQAPTAVVRFWFCRGIALAGHLAVVVGLVLIGGRIFRDWPTGFAAGAIYLLLPYTAYQVGQVYLVWPAALIVWAIFYYHRPAVAGVLLGIAAGTSLFPVYLLPAWMQFYRSRGQGRFTLAFAIGAVSSFLIVAILGKMSGVVPQWDLWRTLNWDDWLPWRASSAQSIWSGIHWAYRLPVFVVYAIFVCLTFVWPPIRNLGHLMAMTAAVLIGTQFWFADQGGLHVVWFTPILILLSLRPNLDEHRPGPLRPLPAIVTRWYARWFHTNRTVESDASRVISA